jgi:predicted hydrocarbon binding protein
VFIRLILLPFASLIRNNKEKVIGINKMTIKEQLWQEIESSSDELLSETLDFLKYLKTKKIIKPESKPLVTSIGKSLLKHLKTLDNWQGDDFEECYQAIQETRSQAKFYNFNPFDKK